MLEQSIADEVEAAIKAGSAQKHLETFRRVTDLFLTSADGFNGEQIELFGDVLERLIRTIELRAIADISARIALAEMSSQLASVKQAPHAVIRRLAHNEDISVAAPVLTESARLSAEDLVELAQTKSEAHLLAISGRWWLAEIVTDALLARHYPSVSRKLVANPGAKVSTGGFAVLLAQAEHDPELAIETGIRVDLPADIRRQLLRDATEAVRTRLLSRAPPHLFEEIRGAIAAAADGASREMSRVRDFASAKRYVTLLAKNGQLNEGALMSFARQRKYEETVAALAELSRSGIDVIRPLMQSLRDDGLLIPCRVAGLSWETVAAVLDSRFASGNMGPHELAQAKSQYAKLTLDNAQRMLRFWQVKATDAPPGVN
ncbi:MULTISPECIES: DUF2336 domain-containing protein [unclassified Bradyrhizobium]|uniref:DUF2336 domain-containing protein n=1 Tax=unclassified Bradyrhizobium TaxID=2631580 RepID=UPI001BACFDBF|nr:MULTISPECIES: DUF2336 domain-containing protein [unclassified Bradyrhizobium]MBR1227028.1 DUF2336 domain-containing protein [Bradyrhizobium sp. AUGA SZCCT0176]MBR1296582.1 DUF2336 domain-containing protein [Bradyrhizobium sp. AUGA SZCCT0042]